MTLTEREQQALAAIQYILRRAQLDPDLGYYLGPRIEAWERLVTAEAALTGADIEEVRAQRAKDLQPAYCKRRPEVLELRARLHEEEE